MLYLILLLFCLLGLHNAFPDGPPESACISMTPGTQVGALELDGHTTVPQNRIPSFGNSRTPPYYFLIEPHHDEWEPGYTYKVHIVANQTLSGNYFMGIILQARTVQCAVNSTVRVEDELLGKFSVDYSSPLKLMTCGEIEDGTVCHKSRIWKINETLEWTAPDTKDEDIGNIVFKATIVKSATIYWTEVYSPFFLYDADQPVPRCTACGLRIETALLLLPLFIIITLLKP